jgi:hypothetical protein
MRDRPFLLVGWGFDHFHLLMSRHIHIGNCNTGPVQFLYALPTHPDFSSTNGNFYGEKFNARVN